MMTKRVFVIGLVAIPFAFGSIAAGSALGAEYIYKVNKTVLGAGQEEEEVIKSKTNQTISSTILGIKLEVVCKNAKLDAAEEPAIKGGIPGTSVRDRFEYSECESTIGSEKCKEVTVEGGSLTGEIVTVVLPEVKAGELATKFSPSGSGNSFAKIKVGCGAKITVTCSGKIALLDTPEKTEQSVGALVAKAGTEEITEVRKSGGGTEKVGLNCDEVRASFVGESELVLVSKHSWGVF
jgi:hypothetical protein